MRHGKSSWEYPVDDRDRPLLERGINDAYLIGKHFESQNITIDQAYSSPANRALHTAMIFLRETNFSLSKFQVTEQLYDFTGDSVMRFIKALDDIHDSAAIFGHNYAFTHIVNMMGNDYIDNLSTAGLVEIHFQIENWSKALNGITKQTILPKQLR